MTVVTMYARDGCHLCDEARDLILGLSAQNGPIELREIDIDGDETLLAKYLERIPVIEIDGVVITELVPDADAIRRALGTFER